MPCHCFVVLLRPFALQLRRHTPIAVVGMRCIDCIDAMLERPLFWRGRHRLIVETAAIQTQQRCLPAEWQWSRFPLDHLLPLLSSRRCVEIFFPPTTTAW